MPYAILRFAKRKAGGVASTEKHNERKKETYVSNLDIDKSRTKDNYHLVKPQTIYKLQINRRIEGVGCRRRKDSVVMVETLITASPEFMERFDDGGREFLHRAYQFMEQSIGKNNIVSAVVHMDEKTPHMHLCFVPITSDGRLSAKEILGNQKRLSKWQTDFHRHMSEQYPELQRGVSAIESKREHIPVWLFKSAERLDKDFERVRTALSDIGTFNAGKRRDEALLILSAWLPEARKFTAQVKTVDAEIARLKDDIYQSRGYEQRLREKNYSLEEETLAAKREAYQLSEKLRKQERLLSKLPPEVLEQIQRQNDKKGRIR